MRCTYDASSNDMDELQRAGFHRAPCKQMNPYKHTRLSPADDDLDQSQRFTYTSERGNCDVQIVLRMCRHDTESKTLPIARNRWVLD